MRVQAVNKSKTPSIPHIVRQVIPRQSYHHCYQNLRNSVNDLVEMYRADTHQFTVRGLTVKRTCLVVVDDPGADNLAT